MTTFKIYTPEASLTKLHQIEEGAILTPEHSQHRIFILKQYIESVSTIITAGLTLEELETVYSDIQVALYEHYSLYQNPSAYATGYTSVNFSKELPF